MEDLPGIQTMTLEQVAAIQPNNPRNSPLLFSEFKKLLNENFAKATPYVYFSTLDEDMVWEIFSVQYTNMRVPYNHPNPNDADWAVLIQDAKARSVWNYDVNVTTSDKIITFSTCVYNIDGTALSLTQNSEFRFVVMAKLVERDAVLKTEASFTRNPNPRSGATIVVGNNSWAWRNGNWFDA
jgi:sortase B